MAPSHQDELPSDIRDKFIDLLRDDKQTLSSCAVVCRAWTDPSRRHLFRSLRVATKDNSFDFFLEFLEESPAICMHIQHLRLSGWPKRKGGDLLRWMREQVKLGLRSPWIESTDVHAIACKLPSLQVLKLEELRPRRPGRQSRRLRSAGRPKIDELTFVLFGDNTVTLQDIFSVVDVFSHIGKLAFNSIAFELSSAGKMSAVKRGCRTDVRSMRLAVGQPVSATLYPTLARILPLQTLHAVEASCDTWIDVIKLGALPHHIGAHLLQFELDTLSILVDIKSSWSGSPRPVTAAAWRSALRLESCTSLESIAFSIELDDEDYGDDDDPGDIIRAEWQAFIDILVSGLTEARISMKACTAPLKHVTFHVNLRGDGVKYLEEPSIVDGDAMETMLYAFPDLETVTFKIKLGRGERDRVDRDFKRCCDLLRIVMPLLYAKGSLRTVSFDDYF